jgi:NADH:ubiquinone reductase (H+-translocating)
MGTRPHVVVVGGGFGGLNAAKALSKVAVDVTLVDANNFHLFQPLLYQVAIAGLDPDDIAYPTRGIVRRLQNVSFRMARVTGIGLETRRVLLDNGDDLHYDRLVIAAGAVTNTFGVPGADTHALGMKSLRDADAIRERILRSYERAEADLASGRALLPSALAVAIVGGGPTGVELAGGIQELITHVLHRDMPNLPTGMSRVTLIEATDRVLGTFASSLSKNAERALRRHGVELELGTGVAAIDTDGVQLADGRRIDAGTVVWAAGVKAGPLAAASKLPLGRGGRIVVDGHLRVRDHPEVFAVGDIAASLAPDGTSILPQVAQVAIQGGAHVAKVIAAELTDREIAPFRYRDKGSMATIGRHAAVAELPRGIRLSGPIGWLAWLALHILYLIGFRNRANVLLNWSWNYLTYDHAGRLLADEHG